jgi:L-alanine-DL-glutamate epimerase-like enolase superfamily enzyme
MKIEKITPFLVDRCLRYVAANINVPDRPGIGVEIREEKLAKFPYRPHTIKGWFKEDGSVAH